MLVLVDSVQLGLVGEEDWVNWLWAMIWGDKFRGMNGRLHVDGVLVGLHSVSLPKQCHVIVWIARMLRGYKQGIPEASQLNAMWVEARKQGLACRAFNV